MMSEANLYLLGVVGATALLSIAITYFIVSRKGKSDETHEIQERLDSLIMNMNAQLQNQTGMLVDTIGRVREENKDVIAKSFTESQKNINESLSIGRKELADSLSASQRMLSEKLGNIIKETTDIRSASMSMMEIGKDIRQLSEILEGSKSRGGFGEFQLSLLLQQAIPTDRYKEQYAIGDGVVDAAIFLKDRILCIDSKFPLSNLQKSFDMEDEAEAKKLKQQFYSDVKMRSKEISKKYIVPEKTLDFAIMFIPSESVFLEIVANGDLHKSIFDMHVVPASPNFLYVYLQALAVGFRGLAVEAEAAEIIHTISELKTRFDKFNESFSVLGKHLNNALNQFNESEKQTGRIDSTLSSLKMGDRIGSSKRLKQ